jgi:hypothetical protein
MSEITTCIEQYRDGELSWDDLRDWLVDHRYVTPQRYADPQPGPTAERDWDFPYVDGSWDEVQEARHTLLTADQYREVSRAIDARHQAAHSRSRQGNADE